VVYGGDFNIVWYPCERLGDSKQTQVMVEFSEFNFEQGHRDIPLIVGL
jgi:hypothetical protein